MSIYDDGSYLKKNPSWHVEHSPFKVEQIVRAIERGHLAFDSVAEVGCGAGAITEGLARQFPGAAFTGFEISEDAFGLCRQRQSLPNLAFKQGDFLSTDDAKYDLVVCCDVFEHVEDYLGFLRALKSRARFLIFNIPLDATVLNVLLGRLDYLRDLAGHLHYFTRESALSTMRHVGMDVLDEFLAPGGIVTAQGFGRKGLGALRRAVGLLDEKFACRMLGGYSLVVTVRGAV